MKKKLINPIYHILKRNPHRYNVLINLQKNY